jgi:hypothetical protein
MRRCIFRPIQRDHHHLISPGRAMRRCTFRVVPFACPRPSAWMEFSLAQLSRRWRRGLARPREPKHDCHATGDQQGAQQPENSRKKCIIWRSLPAYPIFGDGRTKALPTDNDCARKMRHPRPLHRVRIQGEGEPLLAPIPDMCTSRLIRACLAALAILAATPEYAAAGERPHIRYFLK